MNHADILKLLFPVKDMGGTFDQDIAIEGSYLDALKTSADNLLLELFPDTTSQLIAEWERTYGIVPSTLGQKEAIFARTSPATNPETGISVAANTPRYVTGADGTPNGAIICERGATNLVPSGAEDFEGTGWTAYLGATVTITQGQTDPVGGTGATRIQCSGGSGAGKYLTTFVNPSVNLEKYSTQVWIKNQGATNIIIVDNLGNVKTIEPGNYMLITMTGTGNGVQSYQFVFKTVNIGDSFDCLAWHPQAEANAYATSWQNPADGARAAEFITVPTAGLFTKGNWTVGTRYNMQRPQSVAGDYRHLLEIVIDVNNYYRIYVDPSGYVIAKAVSGGVGYVTAASAAARLTQNAYYNIKMTGNGTTLRLYVNSVGTDAGISYVEPVGTLPATMNLGGMAAVATSQCAGYLDDFEFAPYQTAAEIAALATQIPTRETYKIIGLFPFDGALNSVDLTARRLAIIQKKRLRRKLTRSYFVALAATVGYTVKIEEIPPNSAEYGGAWSTLYIWRVHVFGSAKTITDFTAGDSSAGDLLTDWPLEDILENLFIALKPAHTRVYFVYE